MARLTGEAEQAGLRPAVHGIGHRQACRERDGLGVTFAGRNATTSTHPSTRLPVDESGRSPEDAGAGGGAHPITDGWRPNSGAGAPTYAQIEARLTTLIADGTLRVGDRLPPERLIASTLGVSRMTVRHALNSLAQQGLLERGVGRGTFVASRRVEHDLRRVAGFSEQMERQNLAPGAVILSARQTRPTLAVARGLGLGLAAQVYRIQRVRFGDRMALTLEDSWIPAEIFPGLLAHDLRGSIFALMRDVYGLEPVRAVERLSAVAARPHEAEALEIEPGAPLMLVERTTYAHDDIAVEHARDVHRGDRASFVVESAAHIPIEPTPARDRS